MSHHFHRDQEILLSLLHKEVKYLGVLGPRTRTKRLSNGKSIQNWVYHPIGMSIGAKCAEEIAVSVIAEMIKILRNPVREKMGNLWFISE
ncbi:hypothetical protein COE51_19955 [Bacillus pseudomycoides]|nr:hypothetical protein COE51_19955 [Bacillus pseudomycoides]